MGLNGLTHGFYFNIEFFFFFCLMLLILFLMGKGLSLKLKKYALNYYSNFYVLFLNKQVISFLFFVFLILTFFFVSLFNKRFFFFEFSFLNDNFILLYKGVSLLSVFLVLLISNDFLKYESILKSFEYVLLLVLSLLGMFCLLSSNDFLSLYITIEFQSLALYVLAAFKQNSLFSIEAGLKYFILGTFSSGLLLFGISLLYGFTGTFNFTEIDMIFQFNSIFKNDYLFKLGLIFFFFFPNV